MSVVYWEYRIGGRWTENPKAGVRLPVFPLLVTN